LVLAPQMKKVKNNNQKSPRAVALVNAAKAMLIGLRLLAVASTGVSTACQRDASPKLRVFRVTVMQRLATPTLQRLRPSIQSAASRDVQPPTPLRAETPIGQWQSLLSICPSPGRVVA
jgi:hypothetical protein